MTGIAALLLLAQVGVALTQQSPLDRLQAKVQVVAAGEMTPQQMAGKYSHPGKEYGGALSGNDINLFQDGTYIYDEWADVEPLTVRDKGTWKLADGLVVLTSDRDVTWDPDVDRKYVAVHRISKPHEVLLVGTGRDLSYFEENAKDGPESLLLVVAKERSTTFRDVDTAKTKKQLMRESWRPEYFRPSHK